ncbi:MAG: hypothetical protein AUJ55_10160 [Proteobacteria bacterium CG1_02_64_396]|nr:MAG: hypothetical protein AUJ55_10160 [Proteobacteria bacterium CG1_02_64_396]
MAKAFYEVFTPLKQKDGSKHRPDDGLIELDDKEAKELVGVGALRKVPEIPAAKITPAAPDPKKVQPKKAAPEASAPVGVGASAEVAK